MYPQLAIMYACKDVV